MAPETESLPSKHKILSSTPSTTKFKIYIYIYVICNLQGILQSKEKIIKKRKRLLKGKL
jgi:hypothetical protein